MIHRLQRSTAGGWLARRMLGSEESHLSQASVHSSTSNVSGPKGLRHFERKLVELTELFEELHNMFEHLNTENDVLHEQIKMLGGESLHEDFDEEESERSWNKESSENGPVKTRRGSVSSRLSRSTNGSMQSAQTLSKNVRETYVSDGESGEELGLQSLCMDSTARTPFFPEWPTTIPERIKSSVSVHVATLMDETLSASGGCVLSPVGWFRLTWDLVCFAFLICQLWTTMFSIAFIPDDNVPALFINIENFTTLFFLLDLLLNFNTGVIRTTDDSEVIVMKRSVIFREYCSGFFWIDLVSTIPFDRLLEHVNAKALFAVRMARIARWLKLLRLLRVLRALNIIRSHTRSHQLEMERLGSSFAKPLAALTMLAVLAHVHACIWQSLQELEVTSETMYQLYVLDVSRMFLALTSGVRMDPEGNLCWLFDVILTAERLVIYGCAGFWIVKQALLFMESAGHSDHLKREVLAYLKLRSVSTKTQMAVLSQLNEANRIHGLKRSYLTWVASGVPHELHAAVCEELWLEHLCSLGLIQYAFYLEPRIKVALALQVQEETFAKYSVIFKEGDASLAAYMVLHGVVHLDSSLMDQFMPDTTEHMWLGEKALVNYTLPRTMTATCKQTCTLMIVPAQGFQQLLSDYEISRPFEEYCVRNLWKGICGRCGVVGDHFADKCPLNLWPNKKRSHMKVENVFNLWCGEEEGEQGLGQAQGLDRRGDYQVLPEDADVPSEYQTKPDLLEFLRVKSLAPMLPVLERHGIRSLKELEDLQPETLEEIIAAAPAGVPTYALRVAFSPDSAHYFIQSLEERAKHVLGIDQTFTGHLIFLSHHKLEAGTEAALLLRELEVAIQEHPILSRKPMERPVFLDSEDLENLECLQDHVSRSHNLILLLTSEVLTRPWVLIEIATATRLGAPIIPLMIKKPGNSFEYPSDAFYDKIRDGSLLPRSGMRLLRSSGITIDELESAIRRVFNRISLQYSPHESTAMRNTEVEQILKVINFRTLGSPPRITQEDKPRRSIRSSNRSAYSRPFSRP